MTAVLDHVQGVVLPQKLRNVAGNASRDRKAVCLSSSLPGLPL